MPVPKMSAEERADQPAMAAVYFAAGEAAEEAAIAKVTAAATDLWRQLNGVDIETATLDQLVGLGRAQQAANLVGRARLQWALEANPA